MSEKLHSLNQFFNNENVVEALNNFANDCHEAAAKWWVDPKTLERKERPWGQVIALASSELAEALEADRKDLMDDKLTHRKGREVEVGDFLIRLGDTLAGYNILPAAVNAYDNMLAGGDALQVFPVSQDFSTFIADLNAALFKGYEAGSAIPRMAARYFAQCFGMCVAANVVFGFDLPTAIIEKMAFNAERADHKIENRLAEGGKSY